MKYFIINEEEDGPVGVIDGKYITRYAYQVLKVTLAGDYDYDNDYTEIPLVVALFVSKDAAKKVLKNLRRRAGYKHCIFEILSTDIVK